MHRGQMQATPGNNACRPHGTGHMTAGQAGGSGVLVLTQALLVGPHGGIATVGSEMPPWAHRGTKATIPLVLF